MDSQALHEVKNANPYMGRHPDRSLAKTYELGREVNWERPLEASCDGCPGAWYRTPFVDDLAPYLRRRSEGGARVPNPRFDGADWLVQDAVMCYEDEEERLIAYRDKLIGDYHAKQQEKLNPKPGTLMPGRKRR